MNTATPFEPRLRHGDRVCAAAAAGDIEAVEEIARSNDLVELSRRHRLGPLLADILHRNDRPPRPEWQHELRHTTVTRLLLERARNDLGAALDHEEIPWLPIKGMGEIAAFYPRPECRPTSDLDILIPRDRLPEAIAALKQSGWGEIDDDTFDPLAIYNWKARHETGVHLELHYTLWGGVDPAFAPSLLRGAEKAPKLGGMALRSPAPDLFLIAASHLWNSPRPRVLLYFLDLHLLARAIPDPDDFIDAVLASARRHDLRLLIGLSAAITAALWPDPINERIADTLIAELRLPERLLLRTSTSKPTADLHLGVVSLARLLSRRKTRNGWRAVGRFLRRTPLSLRSAG